MSSRSQRSSGSDSSADQIRAFLALEIPADCRSGIATQLQGLRDRLPPARWVRPEGVHLTLKFLGDSQPEVLQALAKDLAAPLRELPPVTVQLAGSGVFPNRSRPRVAWIGGRAEGASQVVEAIESVARQHGYARERRPWSLHLTLARLRQPWPPDAVDSFLRWGEQLGLAAFRCCEVILFSSELRPSGAVYTPLERISLAQTVGSGGGA